MHHFMFDPEWDQGCTSCSSAADGIGRLRQLHVRNTTLVAVSRAPYPKLAAFRERMGWTFPWYSSYGSDFNYDFHATLDSAVADMLYFRTEAEPLRQDTVTESMRVKSCRASRGLRVGEEVFHLLTYGRGIDEFHNGYRPRHHRPWPQGRGRPEGPRGPTRRSRRSEMRLPDEYDPD